MMTFCVFVLICLQGLVLGLGAQMMLENKYSRPATLGLWLLCTFLTAVLRVFFFSFSFYRIANTIVSMGGWLLILLIMYKDSRPKKFLVWLILLLNVTLTELIMMGLQFIFHLDYLMNSGTREQVGMFLLSLFILILVMEVFVVLWQRFLPSYNGFRLSLPILLLPVSQILMTLYIDFKDWDESLYHTLPYFVAQLLAFFLNIYWVYWLAEHARQEARLRELADIKHTMELERAHYRDIEKSRWKLAKIRHDINNQLGSIGYLIGQGEIDKAQDLVQTIHTELQNTKEYSYCDIAIINAVLNEKAAMCEQRNIPLTVNIAAPGLVNLPDVQLCSLFGNLLDNAIHAAEKVPGGDRYIHLAATEKANLLVIKVQNSSNPPETVKEGHGIGTRILQEIAEIYQGGYKGEYHDGVYTAIVSLMK